MVRSYSAILATGRKEVGRAPRSADRGFYALCACAAPAHARYPPFPRPVRRGRGGGRLRSELTRAQGGSGTGRPAPARPAEGRGRDFGRERRLCRVGAEGMAELGPGLVSAALLDAAAEPGRVHGVVGCLASGWMKALVQRGNKCSVEIICLLW